MNALVIGDNEYEFPLNIKVKDWVKLHKATSNEKLFVAMGMNIPVDEVELLGEGTLSLMSQLLKGVLYPNNIKINKQVGEYNLMSLDKLTFGTFIDLEVMFEDAYSNFADIVNALYEGDVSEFDSSEVIGAIKYYTNWRVMLYSNYKNLFEIGHVDNEEVEVERSKTNVTRGHMWFDMVMTLGDGKFLNIDGVIERPVMECFNWLAWNKDRIRKETEAIRQAQR